MRFAKDLSRRELEQVVDGVQACLWFDIDFDGNDRWAPNKDWDVETIEYVADVLIRAGLRPERDFVPEPRDESLFARIARRLHFMATDEESARYSAVDDELKEKGQ